MHRNPSIFLCCSTFISKIFPTFRNVHFLSSRQGTGTKGQRATMYVHTHTNKPIVLYSKDSIHMSHHTRDPPLAQCAAIIHATLSLSLSPPLSLSSGDATILAPPFQDAGPLPRKYTHKEKPKTHPHVLAPRAKATRLTWLSLWARPCRTPCKCEAAAASTNTCQIAVL